jgi:hypothetical protein
MFKWSLDLIENLPVPKPTPRPSPTPREDPTLREKRRFFAWLAEPLTRMSKDLDVPRDLLFNLAAKEGGWDKTGLDHNMPLNNPFGVNQINNRGEAAGNRSYATVDDAVKAWAAQYGERVRGVRTQQEFIDALQRPPAPARPYNTADEKWEEKFKSIDVKKWRERCGIPE